MTLQARLVALEQRIAPEGRPCPLWLDWQDGGARVTLGGLTFTRAEGEPVEHLARRAIETVRRARAGESLLVLSWSLPA